MPSLVVIPKSDRVTARRIQSDKIHSIVSNRIKSNDEQYLVRWKTQSPTDKPPLSWHSINELVRCLPQVQDYIEVRARSIATALPLKHAFNKRKSPDSESEIERRPSPLYGRLNSSSRASSVSQSSVVTLDFPSTATQTTNTAPLSAPATVDIYNGELTINDGSISARSASSADIQEISLQHIPTPEMLHTARVSKVTNATTLIRAEYIRRLEKVPGKKIHLTNVHNASTPSLRFRYIPDYILREGVYKLDAAAQEGCQKCSPRMGRDIGCEYTKKCDCLEYAAVHEKVLNEEEQQLYELWKAGKGTTIGLPKKFPYFTEDTKLRRPGTLVPWYLNSRRPIYECNDKCNCGLHCRNKNVQFGRTVELEIFKTGTSRGWGLRCKSKLWEGQFVDTYRGEIITDAEATRREEEAQSKAKASYLYSLDKFAETEGLEQHEIYVVDGEFMGGPTKFMNHSCDPNCRQYTVSYNKHDCKVYDIAFFACRDIEAGEELTFDYLDKEEEEEMDDPGEDAIPCLCGEPKCRKWLWT